MKYPRIALPILAFVSVAMSGARFSLGTPASLLSRLEMENTRVTRVYTFTNTAGEPIKADVEDFYLEAGELSMVGRARESKNSDFIMKGDQNDIYGWIVLKDKHIAYEYTTDASGNVVVEEVPITKIFPVCDVAEHAHVALGPETAPVRQDSGPEPHIRPYPAGTPVDKFQSRPGAAKVIYWNITGAMKIWTPEQFWRAWQGFASALSMFDVNVTTDSAVYAAASPTNRGSSKQGPASGTSSCGLNSFGTSRACNIYKKTSPEYQGGTLAHETGHQLGLSHDGSSSTEYYSGFKPYQWVPLMGSHPTGLTYTQCLLQYSKGEYTSANRKEDDFQLITVTRKHVAFRPKTHVGVMPLKLTGTAVSALLNRGQIVQNTDADVFSFQVVGGGGKATLKINRTEPAYGSMLDVDATLKDATGKEVARSNKANGRDAEFDVNLPAGSYTLTVKGGAEGTPANGFSNYSSLGFYAIEGAIIGGVTGVADQGIMRDASGIRARVAAGQLRLDLPKGARVGKIALYATNGARVFAAPGRVSAIDMSGLAPGVYVLNMDVDKSTVRRNIVKK